MHASQSVVKILLFCLFCTAAGFGTTEFEKILLPDGKLIKILATQKKRTGLSKASMLQWKKVSSSTYTYNDGVSSDLNLSKRDTIVYFTDGMIKLYKGSKATSGWAADSLINSDSVEVVDANTYAMYSYTYTSGKISTGTKYEYSYFDNRKCIVSIYNSLDLKTMKWVPATKDSIVFTETCDYVKYLLENTLNNSEYNEQVMPENGIYAYSFDKYIGIFGFEYDTIPKQWILNSTTNYLHELKTPTSITCEVMQGIRTGNTTPKRATYNFKSNNFAYSNLSNIVMCQLNPDQTGYDSVYKISMDFKTGDYFKYNWIFWNDTTKKWDTELYNLDCKLDSQNNDTSTLITNSWFLLDTILEKTKRTYDVNGNNIESIIYSGTNESNLKLSEKTVTTYSRIDVPVKRNRVVAPVNNIIITISNNIITFSARNITEITLYNGSGRQIQNRKHERSYAISLDINKIQQPVASGVYIARVKYDGTSADVKFTINK